MIRIIAWFASKFPKLFAKLLASRLSKFSESSGPTIKFVIPKEKK